MRKISKIIILLLLIITFISKPNYQVFAYSLSKIGVKSMDENKEKLIKEKINIIDNIERKENEKIRVMVELKTVPINEQINTFRIKGKNLSLKSAIKNLLDSRVEFKKELEKKGLKEDVKIIEEYSYVFNGYSIDIPISKLNKLAEIEIVKSIHESEEVELINTNDTEIK